MGSVLTLADAGLAGKRVLLRVDVNSPLDPVSKEFLDDSRLRGILPTLRRLASARVIILAHQSRPEKSISQTCMRIQISQSIVGSTDYIRARCLR